jgi:AcrR family transcriptional regulator
MRRLADELDVTAMALYNHVANKEALLDGIVGLIATEFELPSAAEPWQQRLRACFPRDPPSVLASSPTSSNSSRQETGRQLAERAAATRCQQVFGWSVAHFGRRQALLLRYRSAKGPA